jgi:hypothetical protein
LDYLPRPKEPACLLVTNTSNLTLPDGPRFDLPASIDEVLNCRGSNIAGKTHPAEKKGRDDALQLDALWKKGMFEKKGDRTTQ